MKTKHVIVLFVVLCTLLSACEKEQPSNTSTPVVAYAKIPDATIAYKIYGEGEPLLMCIGYASNMDMWSTKAIEILQKKYKVIVFDYRGMGLSTNSDTSSFTINSLSEDANELLITLNISKAHVLGWSMGSYVAQLFAINHPDKVDKLVLYAANSGDTTTINPTQEIIDILSNPASTPMEFLSTLFPDDWLAAHPEPWKFLPEATEPVNGQTIGMQYGAVQQWLSPGGGSFNQINQLKMPVLLICGDQDKVVPCSNSILMNELITTSSIIKVNDSGHGLMYQLPETFANYILVFLNN